MKRCCFRVVNASCLVISCPSIQLKGTLAESYDQALDRMVLKEEWIVPEEIIMAYPRSKKK